MDVNQMTQNVVNILITVGLKVLAAIVIYVVGRWLISLAISIMKKALDTQRVDPTVVRYLGNIVAVVLNIALVIGILGYFGVETTTFAALLAGAGIAIGAAWGGLLTNFAAGVFLVILRPFKVGDFVTAAGVTGTVKFRRSTWRFGTCEDAMFRLFLCLIVLLMASFSALAQQPADIVSTREMERINWMEFREVVPSKVQTVLLPTGTLEPHGVVNNGADITAPLAISRQIAKRVNAMIAPVLPYGMTGSLEPYPGAMQISEAAYRPFIKEVMLGLVKNGFRSVIVINGHGGPQTAVLSAVAAEVAAEKHIRTIVINWWSFCSDVTLQVFGEDGGHAGLNETAFVQAIDSTLVHPERYDKDHPVAYPTPGTWSAFPFPSSIGLYKPGEGYPRFDQKKADEYFAKVNEKMATFLIDVIKRWDKAGL